MILARFGQNPGIFGAGSRHILGRIPAGLGQDPVGIPGRPHGGPSPWPAASGAGGADNGAGFLRFGSSGAGRKRPQRPRDRTGGPAGLCYCRVSGCCGDLRSWGRVFVGSPGSGFVCYQVSWRYVIVGSPGVVVMWGPQALLL